MRYSLASAAILSAITIGEVVAGPTHHAHRHLHEKKEVVEVVERADIVYAVIDGVKVSWTNNYFGVPTSAPSSSVPSKATSTSIAAKATATATSSDTSNVVSSVLNGIDSTTVSLWNDLVGLSNDLTEFGAASASSGDAGDFYLGNCGVPYGSNIIKVSSRDGYDFTNEFINTSDEAITVVVWNKIGSDGQPLSGSALAAVSPALTFALGVGKSQIVAFANDSQVGWAQACSNFTTSGAFAITWGELNVATTGCGYDMSAIMNPAGNNYNMTISSKETPCVSDPTQNYWLTPTDPVGNSDGSCYSPLSTLTLTTLMGGYMS